MCGIAGILTGRSDSPVGLEELRRMIAMLGHRGPDGYGLFRDAHVGLAHCRLSIIDLEGGSQPIHNEDESIWISFNGEIFNYVELREQLERAGHRFYTRSDTEVIVHCYEQYGRQAWGMLNGQFAFALWDARRRVLWLVRDRLGILPLYYARVDGRVLFGSEAKALFASGHLAPRFSGPGLAQVFVRWGAASPASVFEDVRSIQPGTAVRFDEELRETTDHYWHPDFGEQAELQGIGLDEAAEALEEKLTRAVRLRLRADVPVGAYLSGGLDSSLIGSLIRQTDSSPLQTFAIRFESPEYDETAEQRRMASLLGTEHHEIVCGPDAIRDALPEVIWHCETPLLRTAPAPLFLLSRLVTRHKMKVVLTGEGADELLAGYNIFKEDKLRRFWARQPSSEARPALLSRLYPYVARARGRGDVLWQRFFRQGLTEVDQPFYSHGIRWRNGAWTLRFLAPEIRESITLEQMQAQADRAMPEGWKRWRPLARAQMVEIHTFLSAYLLACQGDRVAMAHGVEVRPPYLDPDVVDFCGALPGRLKLLGLRDKRVLRRLASRSLPAEIWRRPKQPYRAPMTPALFAGQPPDYVAELLSESSLKGLGLANPAAAAKLVEKARTRHGRLSGEREEMALVGLLTLQLLARCFTGDFAARARRARKRLETCELRVFEDRAASLAART